MLHGDRALSFLKRFNKFTVLPKFISRSSLIMRDDIPGNVSSNTSVSSSSSLRQR